MGEERDNYMFKLVYESEYKPYRKKCAEILTKVCKMLKDEKNIIAQFTLIGSGARNLVTRNGNGYFDLDYNLEIIKAPDEYWDNPRKLKETVRVYLDRASGVMHFSESQNSTVALTVLLFSFNENVAFKFDVALIRRNRNGALCRLVNNKLWSFNGTQGQYVWNEVRDSHNVKEKAYKIKKAGKWILVRERYVEMKNDYLSKQDIDHPSFIVYIETVNEIYGQLFPKQKR